MGSTGGSAAQAQHLTAELVGRYETEREPLSAICLHADTSSLTAISNDYGVDEAFARQVRAHGNPGDVLIALSTSGRSSNVLAAVAAAHERGLETWALTRRPPKSVAQSRYRDGRPRLPLHCHRAGASPVARSPDLRGGRPRRSGCAGARKRSHEPRRRWW